MAPVEADPYMEDEMPVPEDFLILGMAGSGTYGSVLWALPKAPLIPLQQTGRQPSLPQIQQVFNEQLVAIKIPGLAQEARILHRIKGLLSGFNLSPRFLQILHDETDVNGDCHWPSMKNIVGSTIKAVSIVGGGSSVPEELIFHVFIQMTEALLFLHSNRISHGDVHSGNIMLNNTQQEIPGFPNVVLIDFGNGLFHDPTIADNTPAADFTAHCFFLDSRYFWSTLVDLAMRNKECDLGDISAEAHLKCEHANSFVNFVANLKPWDPVKGFVVHSIEESRPAFLQGAEQARQNASSATRQRISALVEEAQGKYCHLGIEDVVQAVNGFCANE